MLSKELQKAISEAIHEAQLRRHEFATVEHLLFAMLELGEVQATIEQSGGKVGELRRKLLAYFEKLAPSLPPGVQFTTEASEGFKRVISRALAHAQRTSKVPLGAPLVVLAILSESDCWARTYLESCGVTLLELRNFLSHGEIEGPRGKRRKPGANGGENPFGDDDEPGPAPFSRDGPLGDKEPAEGATAIPAERDPIGRAFQIDRPGPADSGPPGGNDLGFFPRRHRRATRLPAPVGRDHELHGAVEWPPVGPIDGGAAEVVAMIEVVGEGIEVARRQIAIPAVTCLQPGGEAGIEGACLERLETSGVGRMPGEEGCRRPARRIGGDVVTRRWGRGEDVAEPRDLAAHPQPADRLDSAELLDLVGAAWDRRRLAVPRLEAVRGEELGNPFGVPGGGREGTEREGEGMDAFVEEEVAAIGGVGRIDEPKAVAVAEAIGKVGHRAIDRKEAGGTEWLPIRHQATEGAPGGHALRIERVVSTPGGEGLVEDPRQILDPVAGSGWPVCDEDEPFSRDDAQTGPAGRRLEPRNVDYRPPGRLVGHDDAGIGRHDCDEERDVN